MQSRIQPVKLGKVLNTVIGSHGFEAGEEVRQHLQIIKPQSTCLKFVLCWVCCGQELELQQCAFAACWSVLGCLIM